MFEHRCYVAHFWNWLKFFDLTLMNNGALSLFSSWMYSNILWRTCVTDVNDLSKDGSKYFREFGSMSVRTKHHCEHGIEMLTRLFYLYRTWWCHLDYESNICTRRSGNACVPLPGTDDTMLRHRTISCEGWTPISESKDVQHSAWPYRRGHTTCAIVAKPKRMEFSEGYLGYWQLTDLQELNNCLTEVADVMWRKSSRLGLPNRLVIISNCSDGFCASNNTFLPNSSANTHPTAHISISGP